MQRFSRMIIVLFVGVATLTLGACTSFGSYTNVAPSQQGPWPSSGQEP